MYSSDEVYKLLKDAGFVFPEGCREITIHLRTNETATAHIVHAVKIGEQFVVEEADGETKVKERSRRTGFYDIDMPMKCSCCERYFRPNDD